MLHNNSYNFVTYKDEIAIEDTLSIKDKKNSSLQKICNINLPVVAINDYS